MDEKARMDTQRDFSGPLAQGRTAELYPWDEGWVIKLFYDWFDRRAVEHEARIARAVRGSGLPVPDVGPMVQVNGRCGLVYQRVDGAAMFRALARKPWRLFFYARRMAELHAQMHAVSAPPGLPPQRQRLADKIAGAGALPSGLRERALAALQSLPEGRQLCHGDFHPDNILITAKGEVIIDWIDAVSGNPLADLARTTVILLGAAESSQTINRGEKGFVRLFHRAYLRWYFRLRPGGRDEYLRWLPVTAAARLSEGITEVERWLLSQAEIGLAA